MVIRMQSRYNLAFQISECVLFLLTIENNIKDFLEMVLMENSCTLFTGKSQADSVEAFAYFVTQRL